uniref:AAA family ATPase n=1 Tax=Pseudomonas sp. VB3 TaxID=2994641 RepID=UPI0022EC7294
DLKNIYEFFSRIYTNVTSASGYYQFDGSVEKMSEFFFEHTHYFDFVNSFIKNSDMSIKEVVINKELSSEGEVTYRPIFRHVLNDATWDLSYSEQSSGTKHLYMTMGLYWGALLTSGILALDEFDIHLHALLLPNILDLFESLDSNPNNAQLIFTSHNTEIIDKLGKYRTVLVNKEESESYCYRLDEIGGQILRNDRPISSIYKKGIIGGVPKL